MRYLIEHETKLSFREPVREHHCEVRLAPQEGPHQNVTRMRLEVDPDAELHTYTDCYGNRVHCFAVHSPHTQLLTRLHAEVETRLENPFDYMPVPAPREREWIADTLRAQPRLWDYVLHRSAATPELAALALREPRPPRYDHDRPLIDSVLEARDWIAARLDYQKGATHVHSTLKEVFDGGAGVCQDFAHALITIVRSWDVPARYVMGYHDASEEEDEPPSQPSATSQEKEAGAPAAAQGQAQVQVQGPDKAAQAQAQDEAAQPAPHAWTEVLIPGAGWRGFDASAGLIVHDRYVVVAVGRDYLDAAPQRGSFKGQDDGTPPEVTLRMMRCEQ
jgi:transglutaminase-like putative cysteine protease